MVQTRSYKKSRSRRHDRKPPPRKDWHRKPPKSKDEIPFGSESERNLTYFLERLGVWGESSTDLDYIHKIDRLVTSVRNVGCKCLPIGLQMTLRRNNREKIVTFIKCASAHLPDKSLLYIEMSGRATWKMAHAVREAIVDLCANPFKDGRFAHGLAVGSGGRSRWFRIQSRQMPKPKTEKED